MRAGRGSAALALLGAAGMLVLTACSGGTAAPSATTGSPQAAATTAAPQATGAAAAYCQSSGGTVQERQPTYGTNGDASAWVPLGDPVEVCRFQASDGSRIYVDLVTLSSTNPTLAALAYLAKTPIPAGAKGNPSSALCAQLGGASSYGPGANGGGLVDTADPDDPVVSVCTFADGSFIDEWGIAYYSNGTVRGADLAPLFRFDAAKAPAVFG